MAKGRAIVSWSGGKDCALAAYRAVQAGMEIYGLLNMVRQDGRLSWSHGIEAGWLKLQSRAMGQRLLQIKTYSEDYEASFKEVLKALRQKGITEGVFGDIDFEEHRQWVSRVSAEAGLKAVLPLWGQSQRELLREFVAAGFEAVVIATQEDKLSEDWLGRRLDAGFIADLERLGQEVTPCGEAGEYHTLVIDGPLFKQRLDIIRAEPVLRDGHWFLDIKDCRLMPKGHHVA